jgi:hypothetical protein
MPRRDAYIYFRVARTDEAAAAAALREMHARWAGDVDCELLRRADESGETVTLMEVYRGVTPEQQQRIEHDAGARLAAWIIGARHVEVFEAVVAPRLTPRAAPQGGALPPRERPDAG